MNSAKSEWAKISSGIPQGSVLGPLLFFLYIKDLPSVVESYVKIFADDTKLFSTIKGEYDSEILQNDLCHLKSVPWTLAEFYFNRGLQIPYTGTCIILQKNDKRVCLSAYCFS